jgi:hypothetical protein
MKKNTPHKKKKFVFIDDNGMLFGKIDIFKLLAVVVLATLTFLIAKILLQKDTYIEAELFASGGEWWWENPDPPYWLADPIQVGAIEYDPQGNKLVEVLDVRKFEAGDRKRLWMRVRLKVTPTGDSKQFRFRREPLTIGKVIQVNPSNVSVNANVIRIEGVGQIGEPVEKIITLEAEGLYNWQAEATSVGRKMVDNKGNALAEIVAYNRRDAEVFVNDFLGKGVITVDPRRSDITLKIKVKAMRYEGIDYFAEFQPLKIGFYIVLPMDVVNVQGYISNIEDVN